jgi:hypothetical protein
MNRTGSPSQNSGDKPRSDTNPSALGVSSTILHRNAYDPQRDSLPFGQTDTPHDSLQTVRKNPHLTGVKSITLQVNPDITDESISDVDAVRQSGQQLLNVREVSQDQIDKFTAAVNRLSGDISNLLLKEATYAVAMESASSYVTAVLRDSLNLDADIDQEVMEVVADIGQLSIVFHALKKLPLPPVFKARFYTRFIDTVAEQAALTLNEAKKRGRASRRLRDVEVVVRKRSDPPSTPATVAKISRQPDLRKTRQEG